jgi:thymidylate synthase
MRSSDAWLGWVYDVFNFSCLSAFVALHLQKTTRNPEKYSLGYLFLTAGSQHLYATNHSDAKKIIRLKYPWTTNDQKELEWKGKEPDEFRSYLWNKADSR